MSKPWLKFFPADWRSDPALRMCSLTARGLWMEMLALMHEAEPYGHLLVKGQPVSERQLSLLVGAPLRTVSTHLSELRQAGVFDEENGVIVSRRMVRDYIKALTDKNNGKNGGNPNLTRKAEEGVNPPDKGEDKAQKPEARIILRFAQNARARSSGSSPNSSGPHGQTKSANRRRRKLSSEPARPTACP
jgi:DNA-binding transcriptional ArsR family regulator